MISSDSAQSQNATLKHSSGDTRSRLRGDSENQQNQQWRVSPQKQCPPAEINAQMATSGGDSDNPLPAQNPLVQRDSTTTHSSPPRNLQQQSFVSEQQSLPQAQMAQFPVQSGGQYGNTTYIQEYNKMMENYFRQQQRMIAQQYYEYQQPFLQQVQQQQVQQPYQQQLYLQEQQQLAQLYYQQLSQLQGQQTQLMQQQQFYHQFMQSQDQNSVQQQQAYQQHQQMQHHQQITSRWSGSNYQQQSSSQNFGSSHSEVEPGQQFVSQVKDSFNVHLHFNGLGNRTWFIAPFEDQHDGSH